MKKLLVVDCCIGAEGVHVRRMLEAFLAAAPEKFDVERVDLNTQPLAPLDGTRLTKREKCIAAGDFKDPMFALARQFAGAELIVVAAPKWYEVLPAKLMTYFEQAICPGITFVKRGYKDYKGLCRARKLAFLTTRGFDDTDQYSWEHAFIRRLTFSLEMDFRMASVRGLYDTDYVDDYVKEGCKKAQELWRELYR